MRFITFRIAARNLGRLATLLLASATLALSGCSSSPATAQLEGQVTIDGQPVPKGYLQFQPLPGRGPITQAEIEGGAYYAPDVPLGPTTVRIIAQRETGKTVRRMGRELPETVSILPARYESVGISIDVAGDDLARHFKLTSH